jgi:hypothetical protein
VFQNLTKAYKDIYVQPGVNTGTSGNTNYAFNLDWFPELIEAILQVEHVRGFGPDLVGALVSDLLEKKNAPMTSMSYDWICDVLANYFNPPFVTRRPTTSKNTEAQEEKNELLHEIIAAKATGKKQINDTHADKGVKDGFHKSHPRVSEWKALFDSGEVDEEKYRYEVSIYVYKYVYTFMYTCM